MLEYADDLDPDKATHILKLAAVSYAAMVAPLAVAVLPRDEPMALRPIVAGLAVMAMSITLGVVNARTVFRSRGRRAPSAPTLLVQNLLCFVMCGCFAFGLSGSVGIYRLLLLAPVLWMAVIGRRAMYVISVVAAVVTLACITYGTLPAGPATTVVLSYAIGFVAAGQFVRILGRSAATQIKRRDRFAELAAIAARCDEVHRGIVGMVPIISRFVGAPTVAVYSVTGRSVREVPVAAHPVPPTLDAKQFADLRVAAWDRRPLVRDHWSCVAVEGADGVAYVLYVEHGPINPLQRPVHDHAVEQSAVQLSVLHTRLHLLDQLEGLTRTDALTGLPNRRALTERLEQQLALADRSGMPLSLVMIDLDRFKTYNDSFGHVAGDELLAEVAELLRSRMRKSDFVARYGGEEFCVLLSATDAEAGAVLLKELHRRCRELPAERTVTFSAGVAEWDGREPLVELIERADQALYEAKGTGRDRTVVAPRRACVAAPASAGEAVLACSEPAGGDAGEAPGASAEPAVVDAETASEDQGATTPTG